MASFTLTSDVFPAGTTVGAFLASKWLPPNGPPRGTAAASGVVGDDGRVVLSGLADGAGYVAFAVVGGEGRHVAFSTSAAAPSSVGSGGGLPSNELTVTANYTAAVGDCILAGAIGGTITVTLPPDAEVGDAVLVKKIDGSVNAVAVAGTVDGDVGGLSIEGQYHGALLVHTGSGAWQRASVTEAGAAVDDAIELFVFGEGDAPALAAGTVAGTASVTGHPGYYKAGGQVFLFGRVGVLATETEYADILAESLPFLPELPEGYRLPDGLFSTANTSVGFSAALEVGGADDKLVRVYFYHDDPDYPDGWYVRGPGTPPTTTMAITLSGIHYPAAAA